MTTSPRLPADLTKTALLLDVDGTILDLAPTPREVFVPHSLRETLDRLLKFTGGGVAFVSGRPISELDLDLCTLADAGHWRTWRRDARRGWNHARAAAPAPA